MLDRLLFEAFGLLAALALTAFIASGIIWVIGNPSKIRARVQWLLNRAKRAKIWHVMAAIALLAVMILFLESPGLGLALLAVAVVFLCTRAWIREFSFLMALRDEDFPGRSDKLVWVILLTVMVPIGFWTFRSFREAHWPGLDVEAEAAVFKSADPELI